jgi:Family of unknown function (DUF6282)
VQLETAPRSEFDPTQARYLTSYIARRAFQDAIQYPPDVPGVEDAIDIHCHAHEGQQDALALAKHASKSRMRGILYKTIVGRARPAQTVRRVKSALDDWCEQEGVTPIECWAGHNVAPTSKPPSVEETRNQLEDGVAAVWMPVAMHANTLSKVGGRRIWWDPNASKSDNTAPLPWDEALKVGHYLLDEHGNLKPEIREIFRMIADFDRAVFFAHATHPEIAAMAEEVDKLGIKKAVVDHPFSPFVDLSVEQMRQLASVGVYLNFTYDELSPLLGVDPMRMYKAIRAIGIDHVTLSSDAGEPLFPNSVEAMRQIRAFMRAFGLSAEEVHQVSSVNPGKIVGQN